MGRIFDTVQSGSYATIGVYAYFSGYENLLDSATSATITSLGCASYKNDLPHKLAATIISPSAIVFRNLLSGQGLRGASYIYCTSLLSFGLSELSDGRAKVLIRSLFNRKGLDDIVGTENIKNEE